MLSCFIMSFRRAHTVSQAMALNLRVINPKLTLGFIVPLCVANLPVPFLAPAQTYSARKPPLNKSSSLCCHGQVEIASA